MGFIATDSGGSSDFKRVPPGAYIGRCFQLIDLGTQTSNYQGEKKAQHKVRIGWELFGEDEDGNPLTVTINGREMPMTISKSYTVSLHEKAGLRKDLASWRGKDFTPEEVQGFDLSRLLGAYCMVNVTHREADGKTFANVAGLTPLPGALKAAKPAAVHSQVVFDMDAPDMAVFKTFHEKLQEAIKSAPEWQARMGATAAQPAPAVATSRPSATAAAASAAGSGFDDMDDDIPL